MTNPENRPGSLTPRTGQSRTLHEGTMSEETEHKGKKAQRREVWFLGVTFRGRTGGWWRLVSR